MKARLLYLTDLLKLCRPFFCKIFYTNPTVFAMDLKKHPSVDLRRKYTLFLSIGLLISLALVTTAFEWKTYDSIVIDIQSVISQDADIPEIIPATIIQPPPPPPKEIKIVEVTEEETPDIELNIDIELDITEETPPPVVFDELPPEEPATMDFILVEKQPSFEGGMKAFYQYIAQHLEYPKQAIRVGREGKVFVSFVIDNDGSITQVEVLKGIGAGCDEEAVRVLQNAPKWNPGKQRGKPVKVRMQLPIVFALQ
jgi:protein TonB